MYYDVFNGDADGICALHQLRLAQPRNATLVTGVKRDIDLLKQLYDIKNSVITVLDISMAKNREELVGLLERGSTVLYVDHHFSGAIPESPNLTAHIDPDPEVCTSVIVDRMLEGKYRAWAVVGAFGDNLATTARKHAQALSLSEEQILKLMEIGELLNYNGYGATKADLFFPPELVYQAIIPFQDPLDFLERSDIMDRLREGYRQDMAKAQTYQPSRASAAGRAYQFPADSWARRIAGVFMNDRARQAPDLAHALLVDNGDGTHLVSVRAPLFRKNGADVLCRAFPTGGGRAAAAGINALPADQVGAFLKSFEEIFSV